MTDMGLKLYGARQTWKVYIRAQPRIIFFV